MKKKKDEIDALLVLKLNEAHYSQYYADTSRISQIYCIPNAEIINITTTCQESSKREKGELARFRYTARTLLPAALKPPAWPSSSRPRHDEPFKPPAFSSSSAASTKPPGTGIVHSGQR